MQPESGFVKANSGNLPEINIFMVLEYIKNDDRFNDPELRNAKANLSSRHSYGDSAIGYVCLQRDGPLCILQAKMCPEHRVRNKLYTVRMIVNEEEKKVNTIECQDCAASLGGCKHAVAFLMWTHRRSEEPSPTEVTCYWKKAALANVAHKEYIRAADLVSVKNIESTLVTEEDLEKEATFFKNIVETAREKQLDSQISRHWFDVEDRHIRCLSLHQLIINFLETGNGNVSNFITFAKSIITEDLCNMVEKLTRNQSDHPLWFELRYGRITSSKIYEIAHCKTPDGSLVNQMIGAAIVFQTNEMKRGKDLEKHVLIEIQKKEKIKYNNCGLLLLPAYPVLGASPDAIGNDVIIEIKSPASKNSFSKYIHDGRISEKYKAQMYLQMFCAKKKGVCFVWQTLILKKINKSQQYGCHMTRNFHL